MNAIGELLESVKKICLIDSDLALSKRIGVTRSAISGWRTKERPVPSYRVAQLCDMAKLDGAEWMVRIQVDQVDDPVERRMWQDAYKKIIIASALKAA